jgi:N-acetylglucosaminyldiphosphoundecaprenol N-acetyl-beta-D-mannosaminyltransferase
MSFVCISGQSFHLSGFDGANPSDRNEIIMGNELNTVSLEEAVQETSASGDKSDRKPEHVPPIFVIGVWRSGTTLLYSLLNQHPDIRLLYESDLPVLWPMFRMAGGRKNWVEKWEYWNAGVSRHDLDPAQLSTPVNSLAEAFELAGRKYAAEKGKTRWGCKSPSYYDRLEFLAREFPGARFVVIWRDPEEVVRSVIAAKTTALWFTRPGMGLRMLLAARVLRAQVEKLQAMGAAVHELYFRDLIGDTTNTMRGICEFLDVPFDPAVTLLDRADRSAVFNGAHHNLARGSQIVARKDHHEPLPPEMAGKISRYKAMWKAKSGDGWMLSRRFSESGIRRPGIWERAVDSLKLMALRTQDIAPRIAFSILPLSVWQTYRRLKYKDAQWVHHQITSKQTTLRSAAETRQAAAERPSAAPSSQVPTTPSTISSTSSPASSNDACSVRLGKVMLQSVSVQGLLSNSGDQLKHVVTVNSEIFVCAHEDPAFEALLQRTVNTIDGRIVHLLCSLLYPGRNLRKRAGSDFIYNLPEHVTRHGERLYLLGAEGRSNRGTIEALRQRCPGLVVDGYSPEFSENIQDQSWNEDILSRIASFRPTHLVVCFGPVKQEMWIAQNANYLFGLGVRCAYGLGGTLDFVSGRKKRAPRWIQVIGAEWLFRFICEPHRRFRRTAKMFKMPYYAFKFYKREVEVLGAAEPASVGTETRVKAS